MSTIIQRLKPMKSEREMTAVFAGLDRNSRIDDGYNADELNLSADEFPVLNERPKRAKIRTFNDCKGLVAHEHLAWVDGDFFYYNGSFLDKDGIAMGLSRSESIRNRERQLICMGAYICIFPDNLVYNTQDGTFKPIQAILDTAKKNSLDQYVYSDIHPCTLQLGDWDGNAWTEYNSNTVIRQSNPPTNPQDGDIWLDTANNTLKHYSGGMWYAYPTVYARLSSTAQDVELSDFFDVGQCISFSAYDGSNNKIIYQEYVVIEAMPANATDDTKKDIIFVHQLNKAFYDNVRIYAARRGRTMEYVCEHDNRLWGCNSENHEIYASALGDPFTWRKFQNIASDSYSVTVGTPNKFTGAISHQGYVLFFKNDVIHKIYGTKPTNYQLMTTEARGVQDGSWKSLCKVNETLFYKSDKDVCALTTGLPQSISDKLGTFHYTEAVAGRLGDELFVTMKQDGETEPVTYVFSISKGIWHKVDIKAKFYATLNNELYYVGTDDCLYSVKGTYESRYTNAGDEVENIDPSDNPSALGYHIITPPISIGGSTYVYDYITDDTTPDDNTTYYYDAPVLTENYVDWSLTTGEIGLVEPDAKYISKIQMRISVEQWADVDVCYEDGEWEKQYHIEGSDRRSVTVHIIPKRCDFMRIRISGRGRLRLYSLSKYIEGATEYDVKST